VLLTLYHDQPESEPHFQKFRTSSVLAGLRTLDSRVRRKGLQSLDPARSALIPIGMEIEGNRAVKNGYGVFNLSWQLRLHPEWPQKIMGELAQIREAIRAAHGKPVQFLIWAGMGGSAEDKSMYNSVGLLKRGPRCYVLDSTDPLKRAAILAEITRRSGGKLDQALRRCLVVGMALGMTSYEPVENLEMLAALYDRYKIDSRPNILYMTLPGSILDRFAAGRGYRRIEVQPDSANATSGRHSSPLTRGSLYPLGLGGVDLDSWMKSTVLSDEYVYAAWRLAAFFHAQGEAGRDKITLQLPRAWSAADLWTKQDFEESLGKSEELGVKIALAERIKLTNYRSPKDPRQDRIFWGIQWKGAEADKVALARRAGYPSAVLTLPPRTQLSAYMQFVHYTVFGLAWLRKMNFVTQPSVELYKSVANRLYTEANKSGGIERTRDWLKALETPNKAVWRGRVTLRWDRLPGTADSSRPAPEIYASFLRQWASTRLAEYGELTFFGDTRYSAKGRAVSRVLQRAGERLFRTRLKMLVDVYEGPAMNHSYHEMIIGHGKCFSTVLIAEDGPPADYHRAQFLATQIALAERGRPVVSLSLKNLESLTLDALDEFFRQADKCLRASE
jgi:glucose-6-phosphate isomerase